MEDRFPGPDNPSKMRRSIENAEHVGSFYIQNLRVERDTNCFLAQVYLLHALVNNTVTNSVAVDLNLIVELRPLKEK